MESMGVVIQKIPTNWDYTIAVIGGTVTGFFLGLILLDIIKFGVFDLIIHPSGTILVIIFLAVIYYLWSRKERPEKMNKAFWFTCVIVVILTAILLNTS